MVWGKQKRAYSIYCEEKEEFGAYLGEGELLGVGWKRGEKRFGDVEGGDSFSR